MNRVVVPEAHTTCPTTRMYVKIRVQKKPNDGLDRLICCTRVRGGFHDYHTHTHIHTHVHTKHAHIRVHSTSDKAASSKSKETYINQKRPI